MGDSLSFIEKLITQLNSVFALKQPGDLDYFLRIEVKSLSDGSPVLTQSKYIRNIVKTNVVPMVGGCNLSNEGPNYLVDTSIYRPVVGALQYTTITRPEIGH